MLSRFFQLGIGGLLFCVCGLPYAQGQGHNLKLGPVVFDVRASLGLTYHTNINRVPVGGWSDWIVTYGISMGGSWEVTQYNVFNFNIGLRYEDYLKYSTFDSSSNFLLITPDTRVSFTVLVGDVEFEIYDELSFSTDPGSSIIVGDNGEVTLNPFSYGRFTNELGVGATWEINSRNRVNASVYRVDVIPIEDEFEVFASVTHGAQLAYYHDLNAKWTVGTFISWNTVSWTENLRNDSQGWSYGLTANWRTSDYISFNSRISWSQTSYDDSGRLAGSRNSSGVNYSIEMAHALNRDFSYAVSYSHGFTDSYLSNWSTTDSLTLNWVCESLKHCDVNGYVSYSWTEDSAGFGAFAAEEASQFQAGVSLGHRLGGRWSTEAGYQYTRKDSNLPLRSYESHRWMITLAYDF